MKVIKTVTRKGNMVGLTLYLQVRLQSRLVIPLKQWENLEL